MRELHICEEGCDIRHYDNCPECFGFGRYWNEQKGEAFPVTAAEAHGQYAPLVGNPKPPLSERKLIPCPFCGSTVKGLPAEAKA